MSDEGLQYGNMRDVEDTECIVMAKHIDFSLFIKQQG